MKILKKAIFWDNDGVLVDTEKYYYEATRQILNKAGLELKKELYIELFLIQAKGAWHLLDPNKYTAEIIEELKTERNKLYCNFLQTSEIVVEGVQEIVAKLAEKYAMAIVTSSRPEHFNIIHSRTGLLKYFKFVLTAEDYTKYKPNPEPYLKALEKMNVSSSDGIVIEDSRRGLIAAKRAGLDCIIIPNELTRSSDFSEADYVLTNIHQILEIL